MKFFYVFLCSLSLFGLATRANAGTLYGTTAAGASGELYILNASTGAVIQDVAPLNDALGTNYPVTGLAFHPVSGVLYGSTGNSDANTAALLVTINPSSGLVTVIGPFNAGNAGKAATMADIAFDSTTGNLYGIGSVGGPQLYSINVATGQATLIGGTGLTSTTGGGLAISSAGVFYGTPTSSRFGTYSPSLGTFTLIANPAKPAGGAYGALAFNTNGVLYGLNVGSGSPPPSHLVTIDPVTGVVTDLGASVTSLDAIAFQPAPVDCSAQVSTLVAQLAGANATNSLLQAQLIIVNNANASLQAQITALQATNASLQTQLAAASNTIALLQSQLSVANSTIATLQATIASLGTANANLQLQLNAANALNQQLQSRLDSIAQSITGLEDLFAEKFQDPSFHIEGDSTELQVSNLVSAIESMNPGQQLSLKKLLSDKKKPRPGF